MCLFMGFVGFVLLAFGKISGSKQNFFDFACFVSFRPLSVTVPAPLPFFHAIF